MTKPARSIAEHLQFENLLIRRCPTTTLMIETRPVGGHDHVVEILLAEWHVADYDHSAYALILTSSALEANVVIRCHGGDAGLPVDFRSKWFYEL